MTRCYHGQKGRCESVIAANTGESTPGPSYWRTDIFLFGLDSKNFFISSWNTGLTSKTADWSHSSSTWLSWRHLKGKERETEVRTEMFRHTGCKRATEYCSLDEVPTLSLSPFWTSVLCLGQRMELENTCTVARRNSWPICWTAPVASASPAHGFRGIF